MTFKFIKRYLHLLIIGTALLISFWAYGPSFSQPFRSDQWYVADFSINHSLFSFDTWKTCFDFELFGASRSQPATYGVLFLLNKLLTNNFFLYHLLGYILHVINAGLIACLINYFTRKRVLSAGGFSFFLLGSIYSDTVFWTHYVYVSGQLMFFLLFFVLFFKFTDTNKTRFYILAFLSMLFAALLYEAVFAASFLMAPLFIVFVLRAKKVNKKGLLTSLLIFLIVQLICILPLAHSIEMGFSARRIFDLAGPLRLFLYSLRNLLIEFFSFPCDIFFSDISYLVLHKVSIYGNILLTVFFLYPAVIIFRIFRKKEAGDIFLISIYFSALTFLFIVIYSRNNVYAITQPRYLYFPAGLMIILLFNIADELLTLLKNKRIFLYPFMIVLAGCFLFSIISNAFKINSTANEVSYIMRPVAIAFDNIKDFLMVSEEKSLNLFVENFDLTRGDKLFLGTQLAVGVYGGNDINVTRDYYDAQYILTPAGIVKNKDYAYLGGSDFTMEFDVQFRDLENGDSKVLFKSKNSAILVSKLNDVDILTFAGRGPSGAEEFIVSQGLTPSWFKETRHYHIVIQREDDHVALIVDGIFIDRWPLKDIEFSFKDADVPFNKRPYYLERNDLYIAIENFYASFGKKIYDLSGFKTGSKTPYTSGVKALGSVIENFFDVSAMHLTNNQKIELVLTEYDVSEIKSFLNVYNN